MKQWQCQKPQLQWFRCLRWFPIQGVSSFKKRMLPASEIGLRQQQRCYAPLCCAPIHSQLCNL